MRSLPDVPTIGPSVSSAFSVGHGWGNLSGVSLKPQHCHKILTTVPGIGFFEVHAENYMGAGGSPHRYLTAIRELYPLSVHGVGLSIGGAASLDADHLDRLAKVVHRYEPALVSEHLAWSTHGPVYLDDLLPLPYTPASLRVVTEHVDQVQTVLGRRILLENPATYLSFVESSLAEVDFIAEVAKRTGCGLLLDVNNVHVACANHGGDPYDYIAAFPLHRVEEIHLAGHAIHEDTAGQPLLIDSHDRAVVEDVWALYSHVIGKAGAVPTLIERDANIPSWEELYAEARRAENVIRMVAGDSHALAR